MKTFECFQSLVEAGKHCKMLLIEVTANWYSTHDWTSRATPRLLLRPNFTITAQYSLTIYLLRKVSGSHCTFDFLRTHLFCLSVIQCRAGITQLACELVCWNRFPQFIWTVWRKPLELVFAAKQKRASKVSKTLIIWIAWVINITNIVQTYFFF